MAHPDDAELLCYGTLRRAAESGAKVSVVICTTGINGISIADRDNGARLDAAVRIDESASAYDGTGIEVICLGFTDGAISADRSLISAIERTLVERECTVLITHSNTSATDHQDHIAVAKAAGNAVTRVPTCRAILHGEPHVPRSDFRANLYVEISAAMIDQKVEALQKHATQSGRWYLSEAFTKDRARNACWKVAPELAEKGSYLEAFHCSMMLFGMS